MHNTPRRIFSALSVIALVGSTYGVAVGAPSGATPPRSAGAPKSSAPKPQEPPKAEPSAPKATPKSELPGTPKTETPKAAAPSAPRPSFYKPSRAAENKTPFTTEEAATAKCAGAHTLEDHNGGVFCQVKIPGTYPTELRCATGSRLVVDSLKGDEGDGGEAATVDGCVDAASKTTAATCPTGFTKMVQAGRDTCTRPMFVRYVYLPGTCNNPAWCNFQGVNENNPSAIIPGSTARCPEGSTLTRTGESGAYCAK